MKKDLSAMTFFLLYASCLFSLSISFSFHFTRIQNHERTIVSKDNNHRPRSVALRQLNRDEGMSEERISKSTLTSSCMQCSSSSPDSSRRDGDGEDDVEIRGDVKDSESDEVKQRRVREQKEKEQKEMQKLELSVNRNERARRLYEESLKLREEAKLMEEKSQSSKESFRTMFEAPDRDIPKIMYGKNVVSADNKNDDTEKGSDVGALSSKKRASIAFPESSSASNSLVEYKKTRDEAREKSRMGSVLTNRFEDAKEKKSVLSKVSGDTIRRALEDAEKKRLREESGEEKNIEEALDLSLIEDQYEKIMKELKAIGVQGDVEIRVVNETVIQKFVDELCNTSITEFPTIEEAYSAVPKWTIGVFKWIASNIYSQEDGVEDDVLQLAFALQVQAMTSEESADWNMMAFEENFAAVIEDIKKRKELNRLIEEALKWKSVLQADGSIGSEYSEEEYKDFLEDAKSFYIEQDGIPEDLTVSPWVGNENEAKETILIDEVDTVEDDGWIIKDLDGLTDEKNDFISGMLSAMSASKIDEAFNETIASVIMDENDQPSSLAERIISTGFDQSSINSGISLSRLGAGRFQEEILNEIFRVNTVKMYKGCVIYEGTFNQKDSAQFVEDVLDRLEKNEMKEEVDIFVLRNERYPTLSEGQKLDISKLALDEMLTGSPPTVIAYPKSWNTTAATDVESPVGKFWRSSLTTGAFLASGLFAFDCFGGNSETAIVESIFENVINLAVAPLLIASLSMVVETVVGVQKGIKIRSILLPTITVGNFGQRSTYTSPFKNRNDLFDTAAIGIFTPLLLSFGLMYLGFSFGANDPKDVVENYPSIALSLLNTNSIVAEAINSQYPGIFDALSQNAATTVRLHWMVIAGAISFIGNTLQLIPVDNSAGSKMSLAVFGLENFTVASVLIGFVKFLILLPALFTDVGSLPLDSNRLLVDFLLCSQLATTPDTQQAIDNLTDVSEGRKILYTGFVMMAVLSFIPSMDVGATFNSSFEYFLGVLSGSNSVDWSSLLNYNPPPGLSSPGI